MLGEFAHPCEQLSVTLEPHRTPEPHRVLTTVVAKVYRGSILRGGPKIGRVILGRHAFERIRRQKSVCPNKVRYKCDSRARGRRTFNL